MGRSVWDAGGDREEGGRGGGLMGCVMEGIRKGGGGVMRGRWVGWRG